MRTCAVLPVKRFDDAKQRLDKTLNAGTRRALAEAMVSDVLHALRRAERIDKVVVVTGENGAEALARAYDAESIADDDRGHSHAARAGVDWALERDYERVLLVPGDCPALDPREVDELVAGAMSAPGRRHRPRPPRHGHQRAAARAARRDRPELRPRQPRAPRAGGQRRRRALARRRAALAGARRRHRRGPRGAARRAGRAHRRRRAHARAAARGSTGNEPPAGVGAARACPRCARATTSPRCCATAATSPATCSCVAHKVVSKAEGALRALDDVDGRRPRARRWPREHGKDPRHVQVDPRRVRRPCCAPSAACSSAAPITASCAPTPASTPPTRPRTARSSSCRATPTRAPARCAPRLPSRPAVVIADSFGRAWRHGQCDVAIGIAGLAGARRLARAPRPARARAARHGDRRSPTRPRRRPTWCATRPRASRRSSSAASRATSPTRTARARRRSCARSTRTCSSDGLSVSARSGVAMEGR